MRYELSRGAHSVYAPHYHLVLVPTERKRVVAVNFKVAKDLPLEVRKVHNLSDNDFVEIRVEGPTPDLRLKKVNSPAKRVKEVLKRNGVKIKL